MITFEFEKKLNGSNKEFVLEARGEIKQGERVSFFGESGAGKSTILRIFAGLLKPDCGKIIVDGEVWNDEKTFLPPQRRSIGFVFQDYALFPHLNVRDNVCFARGVCRDYAQTLLEMMELDNIAHHRVSQLSGGQAQRVAVARALATKPKILILDEPLSALDHRVKNKIIQELNKMQGALGFSMILVSHHIAEIYRLSDRIFEIREGKIISTKTPKELFSKGNISLIAEILNIEFFDLTASVSVLADGEILSFVCHPQEVEGIEIGERVRILFRSFSPMISQITGL